MMHVTLQQNPLSATELRPIVVDAGQWDAFVAGQPNGHLLQTSAWAEFKASTGWQAERLTIGTPAGLQAGALILYRHLPLGQTLAYVPKGPVGPWWEPAVAEPLFRAIHESARRRGAFLVKVEPEERDESPAIAVLRRLGFHPSTQTVQPRSTIWIDLRSGEEEILQRMKPKWRYNIRLAARKGVQVRAGTAGDLPAFSQLVQETGRRDRFEVHGARYYEQVYQRFSAIGACQLLLAEYEGQLLAGLMVFSFADRAYYMYGASSALERGRMPNHGLQWAAMQWARDRGCTDYDLWGIPDEVGQAPAAFRETVTERADGLWNVYRFKQGFGGDVVRYAGAFDYLVSPLRFRLYQLALRLRRAAAPLG